MVLVTKCFITLASQERHNDSVSKGSLCLISISCSFSGVLAQRMPAHADPTVRPSLEHLVRLELPVEAVLARVGSSQHGRTG